MRCNAANNELSEVPVHATKCTKYDGSLRLCIVEKRMRSARRCQRTKQKEESDETLVNAYFGYIVDVPQALHSNNMDEPGIHIPKKSTHASVRRRTAIMEIHDCER